MHTANWIAIDTDETIIKVLPMSAKSKLDTTRIE